MAYLSYSLKLILVTGLLASCSANIFNKQSKELILKKSEQMLEKKIESLIPSNPSSNQHRLIIARSVVEKDFKSNPDAAPEELLLYMLFYQMSRMCREKGAIRHDDRIDALSQGIKYFTDAMGISALEAIKDRKRTEWNAMLEEFFDDPQSSANHLVLGMNLTQRQQAKGNSKNSVPTWV